LCWRGDARGCRGDEREEKKVKLSAGFHHFTAKKSSVTLWDASKRFTRAQNPLKL
jgi:hypothetical protein